MRLFLALMAFTFLMIGGGAVHNTIMSVTSDREPVPVWGRLEARTLPFVEFSDLGVVETSSRTSATFDTRYGFTLTNNSVYPITKLTVVCRSNTMIAGEERDRFEIMRGDVLMPGESRYFRAGNAGPGNATHDQLENVDCEAERVGDPFSQWRGMPREFSYLDWQNGYRGATRMR
jgi:hypothetical protein